MHALLPPVLTLLAATGSAQGPLQLLADIESTPVSIVPKDSDPRVVGELPTQVVFVASGGLWVDAAAGGQPQRLTGDIFPTIGQVGTLGSTIVFGAGDDLYASDGTPTGTAVIASLDAPAGEFVFWSGALWFLSGENSDGVVLWRTDGSAAGTLPVYAFPAVHWAGGGGGGLYVVGGRLLTTTLAVAPSLTWRYRLDAFDPAGLPPVHLGVFESSIHGDRRTILFQDELWFGGDVGFGRELWRSDGTLAGTGQELIIQIGTEGAEPSFLAADDTRFFFSAERSDVGRELWVSDGSAAGTQLVTDLFPGPADGVSYGTGAIDATGALLYRAWESAGTGSLYRSDGTAAGTYPLHPVVPTNVLQLGGTVYFRGSFQGDDELWLSDGTAAGTQLVEDLHPADSSDPEPFVALGALWVAADGQQVGRELWRAGPAGIDLFANLAQEKLTGDSSPRLLTRVGNRCVFTAVTEGIGRELWATDGSAAGTQLVRNFTPGANSTTFVMGPNLGGRLLLAATGTGNGIGFEPWVTDGTSAGTFLLGDLQPGPGSSFVGSFGRLGSLGLFVAQASPGANELYVTDGTPLGTQAIAPLTIAHLQEGVEWNGRYYFPASGPGGSPWELELWSTDGTGPGTFQVADIEPGPAGSDPEELIALGDQLLFVTTTSAHGTELWRSDGTTPGTSLVTDIHPGGSSAPSNLTVFGDLAIFRAFEPATHTEIWRSDGTAAGTWLVLDTFPGPNWGGGAPAGFLPLGDRVWFSGCGPQGGGLTGVWSTDGTAAGTLHHGSPDYTGFWGAPTHELGGAGDLLLVGDSHLTGKEPWVFPAGGAAPYPLGEVEAGPDDSFPSEFVELNGKVIFSAYNAAVGNELYALDLIELGTFGSEPFHAGCSNGSPARVGHLGDVTLGSSVEFTLEGAEPLAAALLYASPELAALPIAPTCAVYLLGSIFVGPLGTDATGQAALTVGIPTSPGLVGVDLTLQAILTETGGPLVGAYASSDALEIVLGV